jgi:arabinosaccharide transport system substrate-binding protein
MAISRDVMATSGDVMGRLRRWIDAFPPGFVPLLLLVAVGVSGAGLLARATRRGEDGLAIWTFTYLAAADFEAELARHPHGQNAELHNLGRAMTDRLSLAVLSGEDLPDLVEIEQSEFGRYLRGRRADIPFVDLTQQLAEAGWRDRLVASRLEKYTIDGRLYGMPHDIHPVVLVYRPDVLQSLGYTAEDLRTWDDWRRAAGDFHRAGPRGSPEWRVGMALSDVEAFDFLMLLWQRGGDIFDAAGNVVIDRPLAVDTLRRFLGFFKGDPPLAGPKLSGWSEDFAALARGQIIALPAVDWMLANMRMEAGELLGGKVRVMPLPAWEPGGRRTSTLGGTLMAVPKQGRDPRRAFELATHLYFNEALLIERFRKQTIVPPLHTLYDHPVFDEPVPFFQDQPVGRLLTELAREVPPIHGSAYAPEAFELLNAVFADVMRERITPARALERVAAQLRAVIARERDVLARAAAEDD